MPGDVEAEDAVAITQQVARDLVEREGLPQLMAGPFGGGMSGDIARCEAA